MKMDDRLAKARILVADAHPLVLEGFHRFLERNYKIVGTIKDGNAVCAAVRKYNPDLVLLDINMPGLNGIEGARQIQAASPDTKVIVLSGDASPTHVVEALKANASGYLLKDCELAEVLSAIKAVLAGQKYITPRAAYDVLHAMLPLASAKGRSALSKLTTRQKQVLKLLAEGKALKEIAQALQVSVRTVQFHKGELSRRVALRSTAELTRLAIGEGLTDLPRCSD
jgi:DNA-binding NarL/FixJ family response regulator